MKKKLLSIVLTLTLLLATTLSLTGCGSDDKAAKSTSEDGIFPFLYGLRNMCIFH